MTSQGFHRYAIGAIDYDKADIARRQKRQDVAELAASRKKLAINPLLVGPEGVLVAGRDRLAAELLNGSRDVWCHVVSEVTPRELLELEVEENVRRRDVDRDQQLARLVQAVEKDIADKPSGKSGKAGRPTTPKGEARKVAAKAAGTSTEAVRAAEKRAAAKADPPPVDLTAPIRTFGLPLEPMIAEDARANQEIIDAADRAGQQAQRWLREMADVLAKTDDRLREAIARNLLDQTHGLTALVRGDRPEALCPYGKGRCTEACLFCRGTVYVTAEQMRTPIPTELLREGADAMVIDGRGGFEKFAKTRTAAVVGAPGPARDTPPPPAGTKKKRAPRIECDSCGADLNEGPCGCPGGEARP